MSKEKKAWSWSSYLEEEKAIAAPAKIFKEVHCPLSPSWLSPGSSFDPLFIINLQGKNLKVLCSNIERHCYSEETGVTMVG